MEERTESGEKDGEFMGRNYEELICRRTQINSAVMLKKLLVLHGKLQTTADFQQML